MLSNPVRGRLTQAKSIHSEPSGKGVPNHIRKPPLTHFLSIPIGHHPALRNAWTRLSTALLESSPPIPGLHESIIIKPGGLHLTLGVLSLTSLESDRSLARSQTSPDPEVNPNVVVTGEALQDDLDSTQTAETSQAPKRHTISEALHLLRTLEVPLENLLNRNGSLMVPLEHMDVMRSRPNQSLEQSYVMWAGPDQNSEPGKLLYRVCDLVHSTFKNAGMLQDERPLKLHCTLINTVYRKDGATGSRQNRRNKGKKRTPFSFSALLSSSGYKQIAAPMGTDADVLQDPNQGPRTVNLGAWSVEEVQICEMGSQDADGVYRSVGSISLRN